MTVGIALPSRRRFPFGLLVLAVALTLLAHILVLVLVFVVAALLGLDVDDVDDAPAAPARVTQTRAVDVRAFEQLTGVRVVRVAVVGGGGLVDLVYEVIDAETAHSIHNPDGPPAVYDNERGVVLASPLHDHSRAHAPERGDVAHDVLLNHDGVVESGERVSVLVGDWRLDEVEVG